MLDDWQQVRYRTMLFSQAQVEARPMRCFFWSRALHKKAQSR
jgi:hypothetical protein